MKILMICALLISPITPTAHAEMISTESFISQHVQTTPRDRLLFLLKKEEVKNKLEEMGVSPSEATVRLASMSDSEVEKLSMKIDQAPAGADAAGAILGTALTVFIVLLFTDILCVTKVFKFTRCAGSH